MNSVRFFVFPSTSTRPSPWHLIEFKPGQKDIRGKKWLLYFAGVSKSFHNLPVPACTQHTRSVDSKANPCFIMLSVDVWPYFWCHMCINIIFQNNSSNKHSCYITVIRLSTGALIPWSSLLCLVVNHNHFVAYLKCKCLIWSCGPFWFDIIPSVYTAIFLGEKKKHFGIQRRLPLPEADS